MTERRPSDPKAIPQLLYFILCDEVLVDKSGKHTLKGVFDNFDVIILPGKVGPFSIFLGWTGAIGHFKARIAILSPGNQVLLESNYVEFELASPLSRANQIYRVEGLVVTEPGMHRVVAELEGGITVEYGFGVREGLEGKVVTSENLATLMSDPTTIKRVRASLTCASCGTEYLFQANLDPNEEIPPEAIAVPSDGQFACLRCGAKLEITRVAELMERMLGRKESEIPR